jgi:hypothetical protein
MRCKFELAAYMLPILLYGGSNPFCAGSNLTVIDKFMVEGRLLHLRARPLRIYNHLFVHTLIFHQREHYCARYDL